MKCTAIVLSAGKGKRMGADRAKQYLDLCGRPVLYYCLKAFQDSFIDEIIIVASGEDHDYIREEIVEKYGLTKVIKIVEGGAERYDSVLCGLREMNRGDGSYGSNVNRGDGSCGSNVNHGDGSYGTYEDILTDFSDAAIPAGHAESAGSHALSNISSYVFIHDGARPFIDNEILNRAYETVKKYGTAIVAVPSKDTVKIVDSEGITLDTPDRSTVWLMQTPQVFAYEPILEAYEKMDAYKKSEAAGPRDKDMADIMITDDAMVMEHFGSLPVHVSEGSYRNIKITTPEDMLIAGAFILG